MRGRLLALLAAAAACALAQDAAALRRPPPLKKPVRPAPARVRVTTATLDIASLPALKLPADPSADRPASLPTENAPGIKLTDPSPAARLSVPRGSRSMKLEGDGKVPFAVVAGSTSAPIDRASHWVTCYTQQASTRPMTLLRWETFSLASGGAPAWSLHHGWFDGQGCRVALLEKTELHPKAVMSLGNQPIVFAASTPEGLLLLLPTAENASIDGTAKIPTVRRGPITRVLVPTQKGASSSVALQLNAARASAWIQGARADGPATSSSGAPASQERIILRIDATQTVDETEPTVLLTLRAPAST